MQCCKLISDIKGERGKSNDHVDCLVNHEISTKTKSTIVRRRAASNQSNTAKMNGIIPRSCYRQLLNDPMRSNSLPAFLLPAFSLPVRRQPFSVSTPAQSRVGSAPLSVPSEVSLKFIALPKVKNITTRQGKDNPTTAVEVTGPLGTQFHPPSLCRTKR